jgi:multidrug efflux system membrane fusion protein
MKRNTVILMIGILALMVSCGRKEETSGTAPVAKAIKTESIRPLPVDESYEAVGTVTSKTKSVLSSKIVGSIRRVDCTEGDRVKADQVLLLIDDRDQKAQLEKSRAALREAEHALEEAEQSIRAAEANKTAAEAKRELASSTLERYRDLHSRRTIGSQEFDEVRTRHKAAVADADSASRTFMALMARKSQIMARIDQAKADMANAETFLSYTRIISPIDGIVTAKYTDVGQMATPGVPLATVEDDVHYRLEATVEESLLGQIRLGDSVSVHVHALGQNELAGPVSEIIPSLDPSTRSYLVRIDLPKAGSPKMIRSGLYGKARFVTGRRQALTVPFNIVMERGQLTFIYIVDPAGTVRMRLIQPGKRFGDRVEVLSGLNEGDRVIVEGFRSVTEGVRIEEGKG